MVRLKNRPGAIDHIEDIVHLIHVERARGAAEVLRLSRRWPVMGCRIVALENVTVCRIDKVVPMINEIGTDLDVPNQIRLSGLIIDPYISCGHRGLIVQDGFGPMT